mmetsp:Transcript_88710/g.271638  ORF Transcript_88710/g.271638 Transcript_88710/m.271638 type:complete len:870 (-) Transcript_88710:122-2731(-)
MTGPAAATSDDPAGIVDAAGVNVELDDGRVVRPALISGVIAAHQAAIGAKGTRLYTPCGAAVLCYSIKTGKPLGIMAAQSSRTTAVAAGPSRKGCPEPVAVGSSSGELSLWEAKGSARAALLTFGAPVLAVRWPRLEVLLVVRGYAGGASEVEQVAVPTLREARKDGLLPLSATTAGPFDAAGDVSAMCDGANLLVHRQGWARQRRCAHKHELTAVAVDPQQRYVAVGDAKGVVWLWWGIFEDSQAAAHSVPARWHWHAHPVRALAHCGPLLLSGGDEGVLCVRNIDDDSTQFVPRFPAPLRHLTVSSSGDHTVISLEDNSLALVDGLHGWVKPRFIYALDVPLMPAELRAEQGAAAQQTALHALADGGVASTCGGRRVQFLDRTGQVVPKMAVVHRGNAVSGHKSANAWGLQRIAVSPTGSHLLTCESRRCPALERFDPEGAARGHVLKWWHTGDDGQYSVECVAHDPHSAEVTVVLAHPQKDSFFVSASLDGTFKTWDASAEQGADSKAGQRCWQCTAVGSWRSRPILSGCFSADGSALAMGFHGFVVLWDHQTMAELKALRAGDASERVTQLHSVVASGRFLILAAVHGAARREVLCWDLAQPSAPLASVDLAAALPGERRCGVRLAMPPCGPLQLVGFRYGGGELAVWRLQEASSGEAVPALHFEPEATARLPDNRRVLDVAALGSSERLVIWTSDFELWALELSSAVAADQAKARRPAPARAEADAAGEDSGRKTQAARFLGARDGGASRAMSAAASMPLEFPSRTTVEQQAGVVPHLVERIVPSHVPSHMLPPPVTLWDNFVQVYAKASPSAAAQAAAPRAAPQGAGGVLQRGAAPEPGPAAAKAEFVDAEWLDGLVAEVVAA